MSNKDKVALFDFCETLVNFQTADSFIKYIREQTGNRSMNKKESIRRFLHKTKIIGLLDRLFRKSSLNKRIILWQLKGFKKKELELYAKSYYDNVIKNNFIPDVLKELIRLKQEHWRIVIVSAGYELYLKHFCYDYGIDINNLISVKIKFNSDKCLGIFDGGDRLWDKTKKLDNLLDKNKIYSIAFSDSPSDLPLLLWADEGIVVRKKGKFNWAKKYNFKELLW